LGGSLLVGTNSVDEKDIRKIQKQAEDLKMSSWWLAYILDTDDMERERGKTHSYNVVPFTWKDIKDVPDNKKNTIDHGFIAQEVEEILPLLIKDTNNYKTIKYEKFAPYIIKAIQELYSIINKQQELIDKLMIKCSI
jgi:hypothetical protein